MMRFSQWTGVAVIGMCGVLGCSPRSTGDVTVVLPSGGGGGPHPSAESCPYGSNLVLYSNEASYPSTLPNDTVFPFTFRVYNTGSEFCESAVASYSAGTISTAGTPGISPTFVGPEGGDEYEVVTAYFRTVANGNGQIGIQLAKGGTYILSPQINVVGCPPGILKTVDPTFGALYISTNTPFYWNWAVTNTGTVSCVSDLLAFASDSAYVQNPPGIWSHAASVTLAPGDTVLITGEYRSRGAGTAQIGMSLVLGDSATLPVVVCASSPC